MPGFERPLSRRALLGDMTGAAAGALLGVRADAETCVDAVTPEQFGAKGDGLTNDSTAFAALAAHVNACGGGEVIFRWTTYIVGAQRRGMQTKTGYAFEPAQLLEFTGCRKALIIRGNGARIKCAAGLHFGTFDPKTGAAASYPMPHRRSGALATPYRWMIKVEKCTGSVEIADIELDGSIAGLLIGGDYGDTGHQIPASGLGLYDNRGGESVRRVRCHHHALDGIIVDGVSWDGSSRSSGSFEDVSCEYNARQACSITGGGGYSFTRCRFNHTGRAKLASAPGAGVDIEAEAGKKVGNLLFTDCEFADNKGQGMVADSGPSEKVRFVACTFVGTTNWAIWPNKPNVRFENCTFVGAIVHCFGDAREPERATQFIGCTFLDDPARSPTREVYGGENASRPIADLPQNPNVRFTGCTFRLTHDAVLPWTTSAVIFADCTMSQRSTKPSYPRGTFVGLNRISGNAVLGGAVVRGRLIVNGRNMPRGPVRG